MISIEEALERILDTVPVLEPEARPLLQCLGQVLADDVVSPLDVPPADNSAMDGFAVRAADTTGAAGNSPRLLQVVGEVAAGQVSHIDVGPGQAIRIMTGAPVPGGVDAVVPFEDTDEEERRHSQGKGELREIGLRRPVKPGDNIRRAGEDVARGALVLSAGTTLRPAEIGVLASLGQPVARVIRRPRVAILATGDEVVDVSRPLPPGKIYNSNTYSIAALIARYGGIHRILGVAPDRKEPLVRAIRRGLTSDLLVTSGGVSRGDYDIVKEVLATQGQIGFWTVCMKPGKPLAFGTLRSGTRLVPHLGLPGNPVSTMITFEVFVRPAILKMMGRKDLSMPSVMARLEARIKNTDGRRVLARVKVAREGGEWVARLTGPQGSGILTSMAQANGLAVVPEEVSEIREGQTVEVLMPDWNGAHC